MSTICHRKHCRSFQQHGRWCGRGFSTIDGLHDRFHFNRWLISHVCYTAAIVSRLFMPDARHTIKRILPASTASSASAADVEEDTTSTSDASSQQTSETRTTELDELQDELLDFIQNLHIPATSSLSVSSVTDAILGYSVLTTCVDILRFDT